MTLITEKPEGIKSSNDLDDIPDDLLETPAAYLRFGSSPSAMENPPEVGEVRTYVVRARCTGIHGPVERKDGEMRYGRDLLIQACWESGKQPPNTDDAQPAMFDHNGNPIVDGEDDENGELEDLDTAEDLDAHDPEFSHNGSED